MTKRYNSKYIRNARKFESRNEQIGPVASLILRLFIAEPPLSAYDVLSKLKKRGDFPINSYKNIHKRIQRLKNLHLITKDTDFRSKHNAIKYKLTSDGIFHLVLNSIFFFKEDIKSFITNYGEDELFRIIYPILSKETILKLSDDSIFFAISDYLRDFAHQLNSTLDYEEESYRLSTDPSGRSPKESPLKLVTVLPLHIHIINSCKYLKDDRDFHLLSIDNGLMQALKDGLKDYEMLYNRLSSLRKSS